MAKSPTLWNKIWTDPVWSKVIAGVVLAIGAVGVAYFLDLWPEIRAGVGVTWAFASASTAVPNWLLGVVSLFTLPTLILIVVIVKEWISPAAAAVPNWKEYTADDFFGLRWRWRFLSDGGIYELCTFCPSCDYQVFSQDAGAFQAIDHIVFRCDSCHRELAEFREPYGALENKTKRFIQQKLRNGAWKERQDA